jgi:hypothetical protein
MTPEKTTILSVVFILLGAVAVGTMMLRTGRQGTSPRLSTVHRVAGWTFTLLCLLLTVYMAGRMSRYWEELSPMVTVHCTLSVGLLLLLAVKVTVPRFFPGLSKHLFPLGFSVFLVAFSLVGVSGGFYLLRKLQKMPYVSHADLSGTDLDTPLGKQLFLTKCTTCHMPRDILHARSPEEWEGVVNAMVEEAAPRINPGEARQILHYLVAEHGVKP